VLREHERGAEVRGGLPHQAGLVHVQLDVRLVPRVEEDDRVGRGGVAVAEEVPLREGRGATVVGGREREVVQGGLAATLDALRDGGREGGP
jgi:hypothetical protein